MRSRRTPRSILATAAGRCSTAGASLPNASGQASGGSIDLGFAIPVNLASRIADEIISTGTVSNAYLGLQARPLAGGAGSASGGTEGPLVTGIDPAGPAAAAGLRTGDVITSIDGNAAVRTNQLVALTLAKRAGARVELGYERQGRRSTTTMTLGAQPT
jgi:putative serine protease PepD